MRLVLVLGALMAGLVLAIGAAPALAAPGDLDPTFAGDGKVITHFGRLAWSSDVAVQSDGKAVVVGGARRKIGGEKRWAFAIARYRLNGKLDRSFGRDGKVVTRIGKSSEAHAVAIQPDGKFVVAGWTRKTDLDYALARYRPDGSLDRSFGHRGKTISDLTSGDLGYGDRVLDLALQPDGKIVAAGIGDGGPALLARYTPEGGLDRDFSGDGFVAGDADEWRSVSVQPDGKIVVAGRSGWDPQADIAVARYLSSGALDSTFGDEGVFRNKTDDVPDDSADDVLLSSQGSILVAGTACNISSVHGGCWVVVSRLSSDGTPDASFGDDGTAITTGLWDASAAAGLVAQPDGKVLIGLAGFGTRDNSQGLGVTRLQPDGAIDTVFGRGGDAGTRFRGPSSASALVLQPGSKALLVGLGGKRTGFALVRFELDG